MPTIRERAGQFHVQIRMNGFPTRTASFPPRRMAERWAKTIEADMIEGRHFRSVEARRRTLGEAIDRYLEEELPKKRNGSTSRSNLPWWKKQLGHLKLADVTPAILVEHRGKKFAKWTLVPFFGIQRSLRTVFANVPVGRGNCVVRRPK